VAVTTGASNNLEVSAAAEYLKCVDNSKVMGLKLYSVSDSPPTLAVRMALKYLGLDCEIVNIDYGNGEQVSDAFRQKNPQGEVPLLEDNSLVLSESVAILQYLADKYKKDDLFYPSAPEQRAVVNHRLAFHLSTYYKAIVDYMILPLCYAYPRTEENLKKLVHALKVFDEYLQRGKTTYVAGEQVTIADLSLIMGTVCLEAMGLDLSPFPRVKTWYEGFKKNNAELWSVGVQGLTELTAFEKNPPDLSHVKHPVHPTDKSKLK
jgi:glutathione S-transferase